MSGTPRPWRAPRFLLMVGGEAMQSGLHFALNLAMIGLLPPLDYGVFAFAMVIGGVGLTYVRGLTAMPAVLYVGAARSPRAAAYYRSLFGPAAALLASAIALVAGLVLSAWSREAACAGAAFVGLWCLRSHLRSVQFALDRSRIVTFGDLAFAVSGSLLSVLVVSCRVHLLALALLALAGANAIAILSMFAAAGERMRPGAPLRSLRFYARLAPRLAWSALGVTTANLQGQGAALLVGLLAGPAAFAPLAAMLAIFAPLRIFGMALANLIQPQVARLAAAYEVVAIRSLNKTWALRAALIASGYGALAGAALALVDLRALHGEPTGLIGASAWAIYSLSLISVAPRVALEVRMRFREVAFIMAAGAAVGMAAILVILEAGMPDLALAGSVLGEIFVAIACGSLAARDFSAASGRPPLVPRPGFARDTRFVLYEGEKAVS